MEIEREEGRKERKKMVFKGLKKFFGGRSKKSQKGGYVPEADEGTDSNEDLGTQQNEIRSKVCLIVL